MARRPRNYKRVNAQTQNMGSSGAQIRLLAVSMLDPQMKGCWLAGIKCTGLINDGDADNGGIIFYASTEDGGSGWSDDKIITAQGIRGYGGSVYLKVNRYINTNSEDADGSMGPVYVWAELTDTTFVGNVSMRVITETWGRNLNTVEY